MTDTMTHPRRSVLVTGATGFVGRALIEHLAVAGYRVRSAVRRETALPQSSELALVGDIVADTDWSKALNGVDIVIHSAARAHVLKEATDDPLALFRAINRDATLNLALQAAQAGVRRFIFISTIGVNGVETRGTPFRVDDVPAPHSPYAISKHEAEMGLTGIAKETGLEVVIIRPPLILGPKPKGNLASLERLIASGMPLPFGAVTQNRRDLVSLDVLVDLVACCIEHPAASGQTFLVSDDKVRSTREILERVAEIAGKRLSLFSISPKLLGAFLKITGRSAMAVQLLGDLEIDIDHTRQRLGWSPTSKWFSGRTLPDASNLGGR